MHEFIGISQKYVANQMELAIAGFLTVDNHLTKIQIFCFQTSVCMRAVFVYSIKRAVYHAQHT